MITEKERVQTPKKLLAEMQIVRFGNAAFALQFISFAIMILSLATFLAVSAYYLILLVIAMLTLFLLFFHPGFYAWWQAGENVLNFSVMIANWWKFTAPITMAISIISIVCLCLDRKNKHIAKISVSAVVAGFALIYLIANLIQLGAY